MASELNIRVSAIDLGSTNLKNEVFQLSSTYEKLSDMRPWIDVFPDVEKMPHGGIGKVIHGEKLEDLVDIIKQRTESAMADNDGKFMKVLTGYTNSLAVSHGDKTVVFLDDPSMRSPIPQHQLDAMAGIFHTDMNITGVRDASGLMKLLTLYNHPETVAHYFGEETKFSDLKFTTMLGYLAQKLSKDHRPVGIPLSELSSFGDNGVTPEQVEKMFSYLGISKEQTFVEPSRYIETPEGIVYTVRDLTADFDILSHLFNNSTIDKEAVVVQTGTVAKLITAYPQGKELEGLYYQTQRMGARINPTWMRWLLHKEHPDMTDVYPAVDNIILEASKAQHLPDEYLFYPDYGNEGKLLHNVDGKYVEVTKEDAVKLDETERQKIVGACAYGVAFGLRQKVDAIRRRARETAPVYLFEALVGKNKQGDQVGWRAVLTQAMPMVPVAKINLPSSASAASFSALLNMGQNMDFYSVPIEIMGIGGQREDEYGTWLKYQDLAKSFMHA